MEYFENVISLGFFCSIAADLEKMGLRNSSGPFDWLISDIEGIFQLINNNFNDFMIFSNMVQDSNNRRHYCDIKYNLWFYHDFNQYETLAKQIDVVRKKYQRRIKRFYSEIRKPTLFIRYIKDDKKEVIWWEKNYDSFTSLLKKYNPNNEILLIANATTRSNYLHLYNVLPDSNDLVARQPLVKNKELYYRLKMIAFPNKEKNISNFHQRQRNKKIKNHFIIKPLYFLDVFCHKEYIHDKIFNDNLYGR